MTQPRNIVATWHRKGAVVTTRRYARIDNAVSRLAHPAMQQGMPGDVIEISHAVTGMQIGTIRIRVGHLDVRWVWDDKDKP